MREILFRGKVADEPDEWVMGYLWPYDENAIWQLHGHENSKCCGTGQFSVIPETMGQYTGLCDKNGKKIFEGDIVKNDWCHLRGNSVVWFGEYKDLDMSDDYRQGHMGFYLEHQGSFEAKATRKDILYYANKCEIIGNIYDNPELLGERKRNEVKKNEI